MLRKCVGKIRVNVILEVNNSIKSKINYNEHNRLVISKCLRLEGVLGCYYYKYKVM